MDARATAKIKIKPTNEIIRTLSIYKKGLQFCVNQAWKRKIKNNIKLHSFVYQSLRNKGFQSQLAISCIKQACGIIKKAKSKPIIQRASIRYNFPRSVSMKNNILSIATIKGRIKIPFSIPECFKEYFIDWQVRESLLMIDKKQRCFFLFTFSQEVNSISPSIHKTRVLGIDLGINNLAVTSDKRFFGKDVKHLRRKRDILISELQAKGTRSSRRLLKKRSGRWKQFMAWKNHNISKQIVSKLNSGDIIVMEDLKGIRESARYNKWVHKWGFYQLQRFVEYKAIRKGVRIVYANPYRTSRTCSRCQSINTLRHSGFFECLHCGYSLHSDYNASLNIAKQYSWNFGLATVKLPNVPNDDCEAIGFSSIGIEHEFRDNQYSKSVKPLDLSGG